MKVSAQCIKSFQDNQGNDSFSFLTDCGELVTIRKGYCARVPQVGQNVLLEVRGAISNKNPEKPEAFLAFNCVALDPFHNPFVPAEKQDDTYTSF